MAYILVRDIEPDLRRKLSESARKNKRSLSDEAIVLIEGELAKQRREEEFGKKRYNLQRTNTPTSLRSKSRTK